MRNLTFEKLTNRDKKTQRMNDLTGKKFDPKNFEQKENDKEKTPISITYTYFWC